MKLNPEALVVSSFQTNASVQGGAYASGPISCMPSGGFAAVCTPATANNCSVDCAA